MNHSEPLQAPLRADSPTTTLHLTTAIAAAILCLVLVFH